MHRDSQVLQQLTVGGMGTEYYCSLEQWGTGKCDGRGDIYSLGMTLDEWVNGQQRKITVGAGLNGPTTADTGGGAQRFNALLRAMTQEFKQESAVVHERCRRGAPRGGKRLTTILKTGHDGDTRLRREF